MRKLLLFILLVLTCWLATDWARAAELKVPANAVAGEPLSLSTSGSGEATLYLIGPGQVIKRDVRLGDEIQLKGEELRYAGQWTAILRQGGSTQSHAFWVQPGKAEGLNFLARPSRVPVNKPGVISGVAFVFDKNQNLVLQPAQVAFSLSVGGSAGASHTATSSNGVAWVKSSSAAKAGAAEFVAAVGETSVRRVVQQVASEACNLRMHVVEKTQTQIVLQTDPIRDCTGNPLPDGTIVTFTQTDSSGKSVVDSRIKKGIARAELPAADNATITVASGVVLGSELRLGSGR
jgi:hypothetical protein